jgi:hypothetical protein
MTSKSRHNPQHRNQKDPHVFSHFGGLLFKDESLMAESITPRPLSTFIDRVRRNQRTLCSTITEPIIHTVALLILSYPICSVALDTHEAKILNFFGAFWIFTGPRSITGFFETEEEAIQYARISFSETMNSTSSS